MKKLSFLSLIAGLSLLVSVASVTVSKSDAYAATTSLSSNAAAACLLTQVTLHDNAAPTTQCLKQAGSLSQKGVGPYASVKKCLPDALALYWDNTPNSYQLCLTGSGLLNLNQKFGGVNWNDQASYWWTGCKDVYFYQDINQGGGMALVPGNDYGGATPQGTFPLGGIHGVGNDQLSSVFLLDANYC